MLHYTQNLFEHDRIRKQAKLILIRLLLTYSVIVDIHIKFIFKYSCYVNIIYLKEALATILIQKIICFGNW